MCCRLSQHQTLFAGHVVRSSVEANVTDQPSTWDLGPELTCSCKLSPDHDQDLNEITTNRFFSSASLDLGHRRRTQECSAQVCQDRRSSSWLDSIVEASSLEDLEHLSLTALDLDSAENQVATVKVVGGPILPRPQDGWTASEADKFCDDFISGHEVVGKCSGLPGVDIQQTLSNCRHDVLVR